MQASLRTNYHYYDYGTIDCTIRHHNSPHRPPQQQQLEDELSPTNHNHNQHEQQLIHHQVNTNNLPSDTFEPLLAKADCYAAELHCQQYELLDSGRSNHNNNSDGEHNETEASIYGHRQHNDGHNQSSYQTIFYDPINFHESCAIEPNHLVGEVHQAFAAGLTHIVGGAPATPFLSLSGPDAHLQHSTSVAHTSLIASGQDACHSGTYFQYQLNGQLPGEELVPTVTHQSASPALTAEQHQNVYHPVVPLNTLQPPENSHTSYHGAPVETNNTFDITQASTSETSLSHHQHQIDIGSHPGVARYVNGDKSYPETLDHYEQSQQQQQFYVDSEPHASAACQVSDNQASISQQEFCSSLSHSSSHSSAASSSGEESSLASTLTRDEKRAREANIPLTYYQMVNLSIDQFNEQLSKYNLSESQLTLIKDIRRRGKNKVAAQSCRKRKMEQIYELQHEVCNLNSKKQSLRNEHSQVIEEHANLTRKYNKIYTFIQEQMQLQQSQTAHNFQQ